MIPIKQYQQAGIRIQKLSCQAKLSKPHVNPWLYSTILVTQRPGRVRIVWKVGEIILLHCHGSHPVLVLYPQCAFPRSCHSREPLNHSLSFPKEWDLLGLPIWVSAELNIVPGAVCASNTFVKLKWIKYYQPFTIFWVPESQEEWVEINSECNLDIKRNVPIWGESEILRRENKLRVPQSGMLFIFSQSLKHFDEI